MKLSELLVHLRKELAIASDIKQQSGIMPQYKINVINIELYVEDIGEADGKIDLKLVNFGVKKISKNYHKINLELKPLNRKYEKRNHQR